MTWLDEFEDELRARHVRRLVRERLVVELRDHLASEHGSTARLGEPREIAGECADELAADEARRGALAAFAALALTAVGLVVSQAALGSIGYPGFDTGLATALSVPAIIALVFASQVALVAGLLAGWRALRRRHELVLPCAEVALLHRRTRVALAGGFVVVLASALYVINYATRLPVWWLVLTGGLAVLAGIALAFAWRLVAVASGTLTLADGPAGDIYDDLPPLRPLRGHPLRLWAAVALFCGGAMTLFEWHAEHSFAEGLQRGIAEAVIFTVCFAALGRAVGAFGRRADRSR